ncbi:MAG: hypothetical protein ACLVDG_00610 [Coprococcus sp.]
MSLLMRKPIEMAANTILVPWESWWFLEEKSFQERCGKSHSEYSKKKLRSNFNQFVDSDGFKRLKDHDFGGAVGKPENSWEEHRWTSWSCKDMKKMLDEAGLPWKDGGSVNYISV